MAKTLIIPGIDGSPEPHWQHWWSVTDPAAIVVAQENWARPTPEAWETEVAGAILAHPGSILVAHSLGCIVVARILRNWPQLRVAGALLVAPADVQGSDRLRAFAPIPQGRPGVPATVVASRNDPWMRFAQAAELARNWAARLVDLGFAGHINVESGFGPWPEGRRMIEDLRARSALRHQRAHPGDGVRAAGWAF